IAVKLSSEGPKIGGRVWGHVDHDPFSVCSSFTVFKRSCMPFSERASGLDAVPRASAKYIAFGLAALGAVAGRPRPDLPSPDSATHFVNSARTGSSTAWPRCLASCIDQIINAAW